MQNRFVSAQFPIDQFRWAGWFLCFYSCVLFVMVLVFFRERWNDIRRPEETTARTWHPSVDLSSLPLPWYVSFKIAETGTAGL